MTILKDITNDKHRKVEKLPLIQLLMSGNVTEKQYSIYLGELIAIYSKLEELGDNTKILDLLPGIHRTSALKEDFAELSNNKHNITSSTSKYLEYLDNLVLTKPNLLLAHIYVRHMGDLYGGKLMARVVPGKGKAYQFEDRPAIIKKFNEILTIDLGDEANNAFDFFIEIFTELYDEVIKS